MKVLQLERKQFNCLNATEKNSLHCHLINTTAKQGPFEKEHRFIKESNFMYFTLS